MGSRSRLATAKRVPGPFVLFFPPIPGSPGMGRAPVIRARPRHEPAVRDLVGARVVGARQGANRHVLITRRPDGLASARQQRRGDGRRNGDRLPLVREALLHAAGRAAVDGEAVQKQHHPAGYVNLCVPRLCCCARALLCVQAVE